jgi:hypothetical protein
MSRYTYSNGIHHLNQQYAKCEREEQDEHARAKRTALYLEALDRLDRKRADEERAERERANQGFCRKNH